MFVEERIEDLQLNPMTMFGKEWMALTAGNEKNGYNTMTVAWGHLGTLWERETHANRLPTAICYVRPSRYTKEFLEREDYFTLCSFDPEDKKILGYLGSHSGRNGNKIEEAGLTPVFGDNITYFTQAKEVYICRKLYHAPLVEEGFTDKELVDFNYLERDFHEMYVGEIVKVLVREKE